MRYLNPTKHLLDSKGRPYFLWDCDLTETDFRQRIASTQELGIRAYFAAKLLRQAKPDDVFLFLSPQEISSLWQSMQPYLGKQKAFWSWLLNIWEKQGLVKHRIESTTN